MAHKYPLVAASVSWNGRSIDLNRAQVWDGDDPFVKAHPEYFSDQPPMLERSDRSVVRGVEQASARPGEKRAR